MALKAVAALRQRLNHAAEQVPSGSWLSDIQHGNPELVGTWPPGKYETLPQPLHAPADIVDVPQPSGRLMPRASGECRLYPASYLTSSGHSFDVYLQRLYTGSTQPLKLFVANHNAAMCVRVTRSKEQTLLGEVMLQLGTMPTPISVIAIESGHTLKRVHLALNVLADRFGVHTSGGVARVPAGRWKEFNAAALAYENRRGEPNGEQGEVAVDGFLGAVVHISDLDPVLRKLVRKGKGFQRTRRKE